MLGGKFSSVNSKHSKDLFGALHYQTPSEEDLSGKLLTAALVRNQKCLSRSINIFTRSEILPDRMIDFFAISLMTTEDNKYVFIDSIHITSNRDDLKVQFQEYITKSVVSVYVKYKKQVLFLIHDSPYNFGWKQNMSFFIEGNLIEFNYCVTSSLTKLFDALENRHGSVSVNGIDEATWLQNYYMKIGELRKTCIEKKSIMSDAVQKIFLLLAEYKNSKLDFTTITNKYFNPIVYASNFFDSRYKGQYSADYTTLSENAEQFVLQILPDEALSILNDYDNELNHFATYFDNVKNNPTKFWKAASFKYSKDVCESVLELLSITACLPQLDMESLLNLHEQLASIDNENLKSARMQVFINDIL